MNREVIRIEEPQEGIKPVEFTRIKKSKAKGWNYLTLNLRNGLSIRFGKDNKGWWFINTMQTEYPHCPYQLISGGFWHVLKNIRSNYLKVKTQHEKKCKQHYPAI